MQLYINTATIMCYDNVKDKQFQNNLIRSLYLDHNVFPAIH